MTVRINRYLLEQTRHDSGALVQPDFVVHPYHQPGRYQLDIFRHGKRMRSETLIVDADSNERQVSIDLAATPRSDAAGDCCCKDGDALWRLGKDGYALFYVGSGSGGFSVRSFPLHDDKGDVFDSLKLQQGDLFGTTLLRPGRYKLEDKAAKIAVPLKVEAVKPGDKPYLPPDALHVEIADLRKKGKGLALQQAQGIVVLAERDNRIVITLEDEPGCHDDVPNKVARRTRAVARRA